MREINNISGKDIRLKMLSIVIAVYNTENFLEACLDSILNQKISYDDYEIICIDDGSTDFSGQILDRYANIYPNVHVKHTSNGGVSSARNIGITLAEGEYVWFVDSDDLVSKTSLTDILNVIRCENPDIIRYDYASVPENYLIEHGEQLMNVHITTGYWNAIYKTNIIKTNSIKFNSELKYGEDILFQYYVYVYSNSFVKINKPIYLYRMNSMSATHNMDVQKRTKRIQDYLIEAKIYKELSQDELCDHEKRTVLKRMYQETVFGCLVSLHLTSIDFEETLKYLKGNKLYPIQMLWWRIKHINGFKQKIKTFLLFFLKFELIFKCYYRLRKRQQRRSKCKKRLG